MHHLFPDGHIEERRNIFMEMTIKSKKPMNFRFEYTKHKLGIKIWGDRMSFHELHELLCVCWDCENIDMSHAEACSYIGVISYFSYEVRHAFMGDRLVMLDGKPIKSWDDAMFQIFEKEQERFEVGMEFSWPQMLCIMASWWECLRHQDCPMRVVGIMHQFTEGIELLLQKKSKSQYPQIEPYIHGAIYAANPYLMHTMEHINVDFLMWSRISRVSLNQLAGMMACAAFGTYQYNDFMSTLKRDAKRLGCAIEEMRSQVEESVYDIEL